MADNPISTEALELLTWLVTSFSMKRPSKSPARDELQKRGFIKSTPYNVGMSGGLGRNRAWLPTEAGKEFYKAQANG